MDAECALTLPISHFKVVYYTSVGYRVPDDVSWSIIQNIYDYMDKNVEKTIFLAVYCRRHYKIIYSTWYFY